MPPRPLKVGDNITFQGRRYIVMATRSTDPGLGRNPPQQSFPHSFVHIIHGQTVQIMRIPHAQPAVWGNGSNAPIA